MSGVVDLFLIFFKTFPGFLGEYSLPYIFHPFVRFALSKVFRNTGYVFQQRNYLVVAVYNYKDIPIYINFSIELASV